MWRGGAAWRASGKVGKAQAVEKPAPTCEEGLATIAEAADAPGCGAMADRDVMARLLEATTDDDSKTSEATVKALAKAGSKSKEPAVRDMVSWLVRKLETTESATVKIKVLRVVTLMSSSPRAVLFKSVAAELGGEAVAAATSFSCPPDPVHGERPQEFVRTTATRCAAVLGLGPDGKAKAVAGVAGGGEPPEGVPPDGGGVGLGLRARMAKAKEEVVAKAASALEAYDSAHRGAEVDVAAASSGDAAAQPGQRAQPSGGMGARAVAAAAGVFCLRPPASFWLTRAAWLANGTARATRAADARMWWRWWFVSMCVCFLGGGGQRFAMRRSQSRRCVTRPRHQLPRGVN
jgi:hypothetical protein